MLLLYTYFRTLSVLFVRARSDAWRPSWNHHVLFSLVFMYNLAPRMVGSAHYDNASLHVLQSDNFHSWSVFWGGIQCVVFALSFLLLPLSTITGDHSNQDLRST